MSRGPGGAEACSCGVGEVPPCAADDCLQDFLDPLRRLQPAERAQAAQLRAQAKQAGLSAAAAAALDQDAADLSREWSAWLQREPGDASRLAPVPGSIRRRLRQLLWLPRTPLLHRLHPEALASFAQNRALQDGKQGEIFGPPRLQLSQSLPPTAVRGAAGYRLQEALRAWAPELARDWIADLKLQAQAGECSWRDWNADWNEEALIQELLMKICDRLVFDGQDRELPTLMDWLLEDLLEALVLGDSAAVQTRQAQLLPGMLTAGFGMCRVFLVQLFMILPSKVLASAAETSWVAKCMDYLQAHVLVFQLSLGSWNPEGLTYGLCVPTVMDRNLRFSHTRLLEATAQGLPGQLELATAMLQPEGLPTGGSRVYVSDLVSRALHKYEEDQYAKFGPAAPQLYAQLFQMSADRLLQEWARLFPDPNQDAAENARARQAVLSEADIVQLRRIMVPMFSQRAPGPETLEWLVPLIIDLIVVIGGDRPLHHQPEKDEFQTELLKLLENFNQADPRCRDQVSKDQGYRQIFAGSCPLDLPPHQCPRLRPLDFWLNTHLSNNMSSLLLNLAAHSCFRRLAEAETARLPQLQSQLQRQPSDAPMVFRSLRVLMNCLVWIQKVVVPTSDDPSRDPAFRLRGTVFALMATQLEAWRKLIRECCSVLRLIESFGGFEVKALSSVVSLTGLLLPYLEDLLENEEVQSMTFPEGPIVPEGCGWRGLVALRRRRLIRTAFAGRLPVWAVTAHILGHPALAARCNAITRQLWPLLLPAHFLKDPEIAAFCPPQPVGTAAVEAAQTSSKSKKKKKKKMNKPQQQDQELPQLEQLQGQQQQQQQQQQLEDQELKAELEQLDLGESAAADAAAAAEGNDEVEEVDRVRRFQEIHVQDADGRLRTIYRMEFFADDERYGKRR